MSSKVNNKVKKQKINNDANRLYLTLSLMISTSGVIKTLSDSYGYCIFSSDEYNEGITLHKSSSCALAPLI